MAVAAMVIFLSGMALPIVLVLMALVFYIGVSIWALYRFWHDDWSQRLRRSAARVFGPVLHPHWHPRPA